MRAWDSARVAAAAGARELAGAAAGPRSVAIDSRRLEPGALFVGIPGEHVDGGRFAARALADGAWGVLVAEEHARALARAQWGAGGAVLAAEDPARALARLAREWRRELRCRVVAVTGSTGKTSTKDLLAALLAPHLPTAASPANLNTEIGLPLAVLGAPAGTEALVLELAMRGRGQIAELAAIAEPDIGLITNVGPVHLELLGSVEAVAAAKAELLAALPAGAPAIVPAGEPLLEPHLRSDLELVTFGPGGDVALRAHDGEALTIDARGARVEIELPLPGAHQRTNALAAVAAALALGVVPRGRVDVRPAALRGARVELPGGLTVIDDCYNANPMSMRAALDDLAESASGRRVAVLGDMLELGTGERGLHEQVGAHAAARGVELLVAVGPRATAIADAFDGDSYPVADAAEAAAILPELLQPGDTVLVKGSRAIGLEVVARALAAGAEEVAG